MARTGSESDTHLPPCVAAMLTPPGRGAVAVLAVCGPQAPQLVRQYFHPRSPRLPQQLPPNQILFGHWITPPSSPDQDNLPATEEVVCVQCAQWIEVHCHGGSAATTRIMQSLRTAGCVEVTASEWLTHVEQDPLVATARHQLAHTTTLRTAAIVLDQVNGALSRALQRIVTCLRSGDRKQAIQQLDELLQWSSLGLHLVKPWRVTLTGPTNVGKSSLINGILGYPRALVSQRSGTTRDILTAITACDGWPVELADTAGLRLSHSELEQEGMTRARRQAAAADLRIAVSDLTRPWTEQDQQWLKQLASPVLLVHNKLDCVAHVDTLRPAGIATSATTLTGIHELVATIARTLVPQTAQPGTAMPITARQVATLHQAGQALVAGRATQTLRLIADLLPRTERQAANSL